ncbi:MAG: TolB-like 6-bladed beta-propeller domain-containing protein [Prevotellaceae bacterium]|jgi:hypothetical protein|nr:TolB-like 6-bladed beta-propeller domain-containing protein [Prevotellaceae bacterium]
MKYTFIAFCLFLFSIFYGCKERANEHRGLEQYRNYAAILKATPLISDSIIYGSSILYYRNDTIVLRCFQCDELLSEYVIRDDSLRWIGNFARKGKGPLEIAGSLVNLFQDELGIKYVYCTENGQIDCFQVGEFADSKTWKRMDFPQQKGAGWSELAPSRDSLYLIIGGDLQTSTLFSVVDLKNYKISPIKDALYPNDQVEARPITKALVYNSGGGIMKRPGATNEYLYFNHQFGNYAEIIELGDSMLLKRNAFLKGYPKYKEEDTSDKEDLRGLGAYVTNKWIYILPKYSNNQIDTPKKEGYPTSFNDEIFLFDWKGNFVTSYQLDRPVVRYFAIDEKRNCMYAKTIHPESDEEFLVRFQLPD